MTGLAPAEAIGAGGSILIVAVGVILGRCAIRRRRILERRGDGRFHRAQG